jgi:hypothetical protein
MSGEATQDSRFSLPNLDDPPSVEAGVILLGLDAERLLAGLGLAALADDPGLVTLAVDQIRHGALSPVTPESLVELGARRWRSARVMLEHDKPTAGGAGSVRREWAMTARTLPGSLGSIGPASTAYLTACWLRRDDLDELTRERLSSGHAQGEQ